MTDAPPAPPPAPPGDAPPPPAKPWYEGKADAEIVGHWQNKGWKADDPQTIAIEATKAARAAQALVGVPADQVIRLPKDASDEAGWKGVYSRLGVPNEAKEYDLSAVKHADGTAPAAGLLDALRGAALGARVAKDRVNDIANAVVKHLDGIRAEETAVLTGKLTEERAVLAKSWGQNQAANKFVAEQGAKVLGFTPEEVAGLEKVVGYAKVMEAMRRVGVMNKEDAIITGGAANNGVMTREAAIARKQELQNDPAWRQRYLDGGASERREFRQLNIIITGDAGAAAA